MPETQDSSDSRSPDKAKLLEQVKSIQATRHELAENYRTLLSNNQSIEDTLGSLHDAIAIQRQPRDWETIAVTIGHLDVQSGYELSQSKVVLSSSDAAMGTASYTSAITSEVFQGWVPETPNEAVAYQRLKEIVSDERTEVDAVKALMIRFDLDSASVNDTPPIESFLSAWDTYHKRSSSVMPAESSLIPMRSAVQAMVRTFLRRLPQQVKTGGSEESQLVSIGEQIRKDGVPQDFICELAAKWRSMSHLELSGSKLRRIERDEHKRRLMRATRWLHGLLANLDSTKLRPLRP